jgi:2-polyprenyl-3-methyl-5-hydroxy-6-metoxy-1,4-benzoquinol methylase
MKLKVPLNNVMKDIFDLKQSKETKVDFLKINLAELPYFRALLRAVESRFYQPFIFKGPILDLGCGDGHFASVTFNNLLLTGVDTEWPSLLEAQKTKRYNLLLDSRGSNLALKTQEFNSCISNSVLEHIPDVEAVLSDIARILKNNAKFVFCVPNQNFTKHLAIAEFFEKIKCPAFAKYYRSIFNKISRHYHCDPYEVWQERLEKVGFKIVDHWDYFSPKAIKCLEWGHYLGLPYWITKKLFGKWVIWRQFNQNVIYAFIKKFYIENPLHVEGAYSFYICQKTN